MKNLIIIVAIAAAIYFVTSSNSYSTCTSLEDVENKGIELNAKLQEILTDGDFDKIKILRSHEKELTRVQGILESSYAQKAADYQEVCTTIDDLLNDL